MSQVLQQTASEKPKIQFSFTAEQIVQEGRVSHEDIGQIKSRLTDKNLIDFTDEQIVLFLLSCHNRLEDTERAIEDFTELIIEAPELTTNINLEREDLQQHLKIAEFFICPERTDEGYAVIFSRLQDTDFRKIEFEPTVILFLMTLDAVLYDYPPTGFIVVTDMRGVGLLHLTKVNLRLTKFFMKYIQTAIPIQLIQFHIINTVFIVDKLMAIVSPFIHKGVMELVHIHPPNTDMEKFSQTWLPKRYLPQDYGGNLPAYNQLHQRHIEKLQEMKPYFDAIELQRQKVLEKASENTSK